MFSSGCSLFSLGMSNVVFRLLICHSELPLVVWGEFKKILPLHPSVPCNPLVSSFSFCSASSFCVFAVSFTIFFIQFTVVSLPSIPCSVSCGLNAAPAHSSIRQEAVRVWLESMSGGSTDFKRIMASCLRLTFCSDCRLALCWSMQEHMQKPANS